MILLVPLIPSLIEMWSEDVCLFYEFVDSLAHESYTGNSTFQCVCVHQYCYGNIFKSRSLRVPVKKSTPHPFGNQQRSQIFNDCSVCSLYWVHKDIGSKTPSLGKAECVQKDMAAGTFGYSRSQACNYYTQPFSQSKSKQSVSQGGVGSLECLTWLS